MGEVFVRSEDKNNDFVRWEKFLPKLVLRILLVEADDSTRQIITALLRKCSYKVAAVSDGLKAWEVLKGRSHDIDLILTEVELPSISGFALLTLIMEHQVCKNIPVIMMSAHDSVSTVYKCMLKGAADFLVKPVRKNELKNLWQHVWRRQSSTTGEINALQKVEATAENNSTSSGYMACIEIGSDTQSSCTKPDMESDEPPMDQPMRSEQLETEPEGHMCKADTSGHMVTEAIDLIGSFDSYPKTSYSSLLNYGTNDPSPILDLSLRRSHPSIVSDRLKQSDVSAFSRYINKTQVSNTNQQKEYEISSDRQLSVGYISDTHSSPKERVFPVPVPAFCVQPQKMQSPCCSGQPNFQTNAYYIPNPETSPETEALEDHSATSSWCNGGTLARLNSGSNGNRSTQREAALNKFRLKRKDRCFDKKVRYESRKKLAEQRPRVKGQFVRRGQTNNPDTELTTIT